MRRRRGFIDIPLTKKMEKNGLKERKLQMLWEVLNGSHARTQIFAFPVASLAVSTVKPTV
jgi:hypothetical protein